MDDVHSVRPQHRSRSLWTGFVLVLALLLQLIVPLFPSADQAYAAERTAYSLIAGTPANGTIGHEYAFQFKINDPLLRRVTLIDGALPPGLTLDIDGYLHGTPSRAGTYNFAVALRDTAGTSVARRAQVVVAGAPVSLVPVFGRLYSANPNIALIRPAIGNSNVTAGPPGATPSFSAPTSISGGGTPTQLVGGDLNGDGRSDMVTSNYSAAQVSVWLNTTATGAATPSFSARTDLPMATSGGWNIALADVNGDSLLDIVVGTGGATTISIWLNTTAVGATTPSFATRADITTSSIYPQFMTVGDINRDTRPDLIVTNFGNGAGTNIGILLNTTSNDAATPSFSAVTTFAAPQGPAGVVAADFNGDGAADIAVNSSQGSIVGVYLNTTPVEAATPTLSTRTDITLGVQGWGLATSDLNNDSVPDLIVATTLVPQTLVCC